MITSVKMKKFAILFMLAIVCAGIGTVSAQSFQEVVYLKNGSIIRGLIVEQIPNKSLKIQMADGSIFVYEMTDVEKITKEQITNRPVRSTFTTDTSTSGVFQNGRGPQKGYRGFVDLGYTIGTGDFGLDRIEFSTTHGYQILPCLFAGAGVGVHYYFDAEAVEIPIFADLRADLLKHSVCPFIDMKIGYTVHEDTGFYFNPMVGVRFAVGAKSAVNFGIGYTMQRIEYRYVSGGYSIPDSFNCGGFSIKLGFEF